MKRIIVILISLLFLTGCWDLGETEQVGFATFIGIDIADNNQIKLMIQDMSPPTGVSGKQSGDTSGNTAVESHEATAQTMSEAINQINTTNDEVTDLSHTYVIALSEEFVEKKGISPVIDFFERTPAIRRNVLLLIAKKGKLNDLCNPDALSTSNSNSGKSIMEIIRNKQDCSIISAITLGEFLNMTWETGEDAYTAGVSSINKSTEKTDLFDISIGDTAVFKGEKFSGWLDNEETIGLLLAKGKIKGGTISVNIQGENISLNITRVKSKFKPELNGDKMKVLIDINVESKLAESQTRQSFIDLNIINNVNDALQKKIQTQVISTFERTQALDTDVFGFGNYFFGEYPEYWRQIEANNVDYYRDVTIELNVETKIRYLGLIK